MKNLLFLVLLAIGLLSGCVREGSDTVDQDRIFTEYELFYNANQDKTYARATFKFSNGLGTKLELAQSSEINFNGDLLTFRPVLAFYEREYAGLVQSGTFQWTDLDGNSFSNQISIHEIAYPAELDTIDRSSSFELIWDGDPIAEKELVTVTINGENEADARAWASGDIGATSIILSKDKLGQVGQGPGKIWLDRSYLPGLTEATSAGGIINGRYRPENKEVYLK